MSKTLEIVKTLVAAAEVRISEHGYDELVEDGIAVRDVLNGVAEAVAVEDYPDFVKGRRCWCLRPETVELLEKSKGMVQAFYAPATSSAYQRALKAHIAIDNVPNEEFETRRTEAIVAMAKELGIKQP